MSLPKNDSGCGWLNTLPPREPSPALVTNEKCDWLIIGAGYTGLSAARELSVLRPNDKIIILEAEKAAEGASARNSGYLVDSTLNDGHMSDQGMKRYRQKYDLNLRALESVRRFVNDNNVECDWQEAGKFHATSMKENEAKLELFHSVLNECGIANTLISDQDLHSRLGTSFYRMAVHTQGGVMLQPAKLARAMVSVLPENVSLYEHSPVLELSHSTARTVNGSVKANNIFICTNGFIPSLGFKKDRVFPLSLTASLTRPLTEKEHQDIGSPKPWGLLSAQAMGATVRLTADNRIMIRNTAEAIRDVNLSSQEILKRKNVHADGIARRFPSLPPDMIEHSWAGVTCISENSANLFEKVNANTWVAGCYNGGGIGLATHYGEQLAHFACGYQNQDIDMILQRPTPRWLPPNPFLLWGVKMRLAKDRLMAKYER